MTFYKEYSESAEISRIEKVPQEEFEELHNLWRPANAWRFRYQPAGAFLDWHPSDRKLFFVLLSGKFELCASDGSSAVLEAGDICVINDYGKGHTGRVIGGEPCEILQVELPEG